MFAFQLCDFLTGNAKLHTEWHGGVLAELALHTQRKARGTRPAFGTGSTDMALAFFFNALLYEIHCISHQWISCASLLIASAVTRSSSAASTWFSWRDVI
ncbi:hypothetical protein J4734_20530 [Klebsiella pneumoniae]|uniref:Uncharacterized protein n=1 Tax=Klebsiella pneumoniae TaxID=573 RepID=A0A939SQB4_KLEPN|nr:hypothetical protein [Klebsiella pneumoniae]